METPDERFLEDLRATFEDSLLYTRISERLIIALELSKPLAVALGKIIELDPDLVPELDASLAALSEMAAALGRGMDFATAKYEIANARRGFGPKKGTPDAE